MASKEGEMGTPTQDGVQTFTLQGQSTVFQSKKTDIFGSLDSLEQNYKKNLVDRFSTSDASSSGTDPQTTSKVEKLDDCIDEKSKEKFKRPEFPVSRPRGEKRQMRFELDVNKFRRTGRDARGRGWRGKVRGFTPDHKLNPEKWTKYSLEDTEVSGNSMNSKVAFSIIDDLRRRREGAVSEPKVDLDSKMIFSKPKLSESSSEETAGGFEEIKIKGDVRRMEEYNFGTKQINKKKKFHQSDDDRNLDNVNLNHLEEPHESSENVLNSDILVSGDDGGSHVNEPKEEQSKGFKSLKKGKGKRQIRGRNLDDDG